MSEVVDPSELLEPDESLVYGTMLPEYRVVASVNGQRSVHWASVTKLITTLAVLTAAEDGYFALKSTVGEYSLEVQDLLCHASGLATGNPGGRELIEPQKVEPSVPAGTRRIYSNIGFELLGFLLERETKVSLKDYCREKIFTPLGIIDSRYDEDLLAGARGAAFGLVTSTEQMATVASAFVHPILISDGSLERVTQPCYPELAGILPGFGRMVPNPWGEGPEIRGNKSPHWTGSVVSPQTFGHFGQSGTFLWIDPVSHFFAVFAGTKPFGLWAVRRWPVLNDAINVLLSSRV